MRRYPTFSFETWLPNLHVQVEVEVTYSGGRDDCEIEQIALVALKFQDGWHHLPHPAPIDDDDILIEAEERLNDEFDEYDYRSNREDWR